MKWIVGCLLVLTASRAGAEMVADDTPPMARACPRGESWESVTHCLVKHGRTARVIRELADARLVQIDLLGQPASDDGLLLYVHYAKQWSLGGIYGATGATAEILAFEPVTVDGRTGYRIDLGSTALSSISLDGATTVPAFSLQRSSVYCSGTSWTCAVIVTACDVLVHGNALWSFRGSVTLRAGQAYVAGDRSNSGAACVVAEHVALDWPAS